MTERDDVLHDGPTDEPDDIVGPPDDVNDEDAEVPVPDYVEDPGDAATHAAIEPMGGLFSGRHQDIE